MQGTKLLRGTTLIPKKHPFLQGSHLRVTGATRLEILKIHQQAKTVCIPCTSFLQAAPVGNSTFRLNLRKLAAGGFLSLIENEMLLYTFIAFITVLYFIQFSKKCQALLTRAFLLHSSSRK